MTGVIAQLRTQSPVARSADFVRLAAENRLGILRCIGAKTSCQCRVRPRRLLYP